MEIDSVTYEIVDSVTWISVEERPRRLVVGKLTAAFREIGTGISEASKRVPIFLHDVRGGKQASSYFG
jgi:hypothetical protein